MNMALTNNYSGTGLAACLCVNQTENKTECPSIDNFRNQVYSTMYSIITLLGMLGNGFALLVLLRTYQKKSPFQVYMMNLAVSDLLCVSMLPFRIHYYANKGQWYLGDFICRISSYTFYVNLYCSILFMAAMSVSRFLAIVFPVQNIRLVTECRARLACIFIWVFVCAMSSPFLMSGETQDPFTNKTKCYEPPRTGTSTKLVVLNYLSLVVGFLIPFLIILVCSAGIIRSLCLRRTNTHRGAKGSRAIRMIVIVLVTFLVCFTPYHVQRSVHLSFLSNGSCERLIFMQKSVVVTLSLAASNCCFDPLLYFFSGEGFRRRMSTMRTSGRRSIQLKQGKAGEPLAIKAVVPET
ncbi:cysteinyl leukotriene receptor 1 [Gadus chalcogrammus]|uniref:cysteinyl leukotriene receptor 1 n=1 Tax=Gadus chalcogrammus TaxID=1042646 RepID=UPI0024C4A4E4|nr:cysteinyl leukotriene receptor 1 [Gadus chalcogrammus]